MAEFDPCEIAGEVVTKALDSEIVRNLFGPVSANIGQMLGAVSGVIRFYAEENLGSTFTKWAKQRNEVPLNAEEVKRVLPLLHDAAMQSDEDLQDRWASLLESTAQNRNKVLPSFGQTLAQLTVTEARYLDRIWEAVTAPKSMNSGKRRGRDELSLDALLRIYDPSLRTSPNPAEMWLFRARMSPEQIESYDAVTQFELVMNDLERLSLLEKVIEVGMVEHRLREVGTKTMYALTQYGVNFILAVAAPTGGF